MISYNAFKPLLLGAFALLLANCTASRTTIVDESTGDRKSTINLGQIEVLKHHGVIGSMRGQLSEVLKKDGAHFYVFDFTSSAEGITQNACPLVRKNASVNFIVDGKNEHFHTMRDGNIVYPLPGFLLLSCLEYDIEVGPLDKDFLNRIANAKDVKFQIQGENGYILGKINQFEQEEIARFIAHSEPPK